MTEAAVHSKTVKLLLFIHCLLLLSLFVWILCCCLLFVASFLQKLAIRLTSSLRFQVH